MTNGNVTSVSSNARQKVVYEPKVKRWMSMNLPVPLTTFRFWLYYVTVDNQAKRLQLNMDEYFEIKLRFNKISQDSND